MTKNNIVLPFLNLTMKNLTNKVLVFTFSQLMMNRKFIISLYFSGYVLTLPDN